MQYSRIAKNAKLGDGSIIKSCRNAHLKFMTTDLNLLKIKRVMCLTEGFTVADIGTQASGYGGTKTIYRFDSHVHERITEVANASLSDLIKSIDKIDLYLWYLDDGSWHKDRHTMHLYSNMLDDEETELLIKQIENLYGIAPRKRTDRKKDGRSFLYLYFPRDLVKVFRPELKRFVTSLELDSMYYKFGGLEYEEAV